MKPIDVPYLQAPHCHSILVSWITDFQIESIVEFGLNKNNLNQKAIGNSTKVGENHTINTVKLENLNPDTQYFYRTKSGNEYSQIASFKTQVDATTSNKNLRFIVIGDHQRFDDLYPNLVQKAKSKALEIWKGNSIEETVNFVMNLGDQVHNGGELSHYRIHHFYKSSELASTIPFSTVLGNHEYYGDPEAKNYFAHFDYSHLNYNKIQQKNTANQSEYYAFRIAKAIFIQLNSNVNCDDQTQFVKQIIQEADSDISIDWIIVSAHHPPRAEQLKKDGNSYISDTIMPIIASSNKTALYFAGHAHLYARGANRNHRIHEIINGGASWDQYWTDTPEAVTLYEDVQKTIEAHVFQLVEIDFEKQEIKVKTYSTGNAQKEKPLYLLDSFYKKKKENPPQKPFISNSKATITLPYTFLGSSYFGIEPLNSSAFEVFKITENNEVVVLSKKRDFEKFFGSSGAPDFEPTNIHQSINILTLSLKEMELQSGKYGIRVRYRDQNLSWSEWSEIHYFEIK